ncbi:MAG: DNA-binding protein [Cyclobacteriaceae bacterium]
MNLTEHEQRTFFERVEALVGVIMEKYNPPQDRYIDGEEAMRKLRIKSKTTLQKYRDEQRIAFTETDPILYDRFSIDEYLEKRTIKPL